jgi:large subunit ribosomal protein L23
MAKEKKIIEKTEEVTEITSIVKPLITEKASLQSSSNAYTFVVKTNATKLGIIAQMKSKYKVTPIKVNITNLPAKKVVVRGRAGVKSGIKKAIVFLKKGDTIKLA